MTMQFEEDDAADVPEPPITTVLILGRSHTGKSNLVRTLLKRFEAYEKEILIVNDRTPDCPFRAVQWHELAQVENCILICEDVLTATTRQYRSVCFSAAAAAAKVPPFFSRILQELLNFQAHHRRVNPIFVVSHSMHRQVNVLRTPTCTSLFLFFSCFPPQPKSDWSTPFFHRNLDICLQSQRQKSETAAGVLRI